MATIIKGDTRREIAFLIEDEGDPVDLTGESIEVRYRIGNGTLKRKALIISDPPSGRAVLRAASDNWDLAGKAKGRLVFISGNKEGKTIDWTLDVEEDDLVV